MYETSGEYRFILTDRKFMPGSLESGSLQHGFGADETSERPCRMQISLRARLTPKWAGCDWYKPHGSNYSLEILWERDQHRVRFADNMDTNVSARNAFSC